MSRLLLGGRLGLGLAVALLVSVGCATAPDLPFPAPATTGNGHTEPQATVLAAPPVAAPDSETCTRYIERVNGQVVCIDQLIPVLLQQQVPDNDGDGIPNINDEDIDGDGIPNGYDLDTDGDGISNSTDDDIDGDGVANEDDVDIDGDFLRNRWDLDMDGDLLYNPLDNDADGDGLEKRITLPEIECGPVDLFNDPDACGDEQEEEECNEGDNGGDTNGEAADPCRDEGPDDNTNNGRNVPLPDAPVGLDSDDDDDEAFFDQPTADEIARFNDQALLDDLPSLEAVLAPLDPEDTDADVLDAATRLAEGSLDADTVNSNGSLTQTFSDQGRADHEARVDAVVTLATLPDVPLSDAVDVTERFTAVMQALSIEIDNLVNAAVEVDHHRPGTSLLEDGELATTLIADADAVDIPDDDVPEAIGPTVRTATAIDNSDPVAVWRVVVNQADAFRDENEAIEFSLLKAVRVVERVTNLSENPTLDEVNDSTGNILEAASQNGVEDPLAIVDALEARADADSTFVISDGIDAGEAATGANDVATNP